MGNLLVLSLGCMVPEVTKEELIRMFVDKTLFGYLLKKNLIKKGDTICYAKITGITLEELLAYFEVHGYPGLDIPRYQIKTSPAGGEGDTEWTLHEGVYQVWYTERHTHTCVFSTASKDDFRAYWMRENISVWEYLLCREWVF